MAENNPTTEVHVHKPDEHGRALSRSKDELCQRLSLGQPLVIEAEQHWTNKDAPNATTVTETHHQKEQLVIDNPTDPLSTVTHRLEEIHVTVADETSTPRSQELGQCIALGTLATYISFSLALARTPMDVPTTEDVKGKWSRQRCTNHTGDRCFRQG